MRLIAQQGMVNIDGEVLAYGNIRNMYKTGSGYGLQLSEKLEHRREEITDICGKIADYIYALQDIISEGD